ncbi:MAG: hypothetical protein ACRELW_15860 [Candidatus Rokuibacteriota bacterium]
MADPAGDVLRWVREGERLFGQTLETLHRCREVELEAEALADENRRLREELEAIREEVRQLRSERFEAAESLKAIAEHVTRLATVALQRLGKPVS